MSDPLPARRALLTAGLVAVSVLAAGCSADDARPVGQAPSVAGSPSSDGTSTDAWVRGLDRPTGIGFALPEAARPARSTRPAQGGAEVVSREYAAAVGDVRLSVSVLTTPTQPAAVRRTVRAQYLPFLVVDTVQAQGASEAGVVSNSRLRGVGLRGYDSQLTFVQKDRRAVWFTRAVELPRTVVVAQAVAYVRPDEDAVDRVRAQFRRLTDGLDIPTS
ncbi:hypothetical protein [Nocardioides marmoribigeumensis]|uniref:DUF1795 domain-containing protein n=1 Tax=Nocardioides marmoribigeumensis TaxID=433649 RepID=A0ABU2C1K6_9ACTN|nr:hypothetical protein [Nocardioides marmoribigeumensis]MDR7364526.1 hypothetical protein [Nocardioides marmoribigeumensis]